MGFCNAYESKSMTEVTGETLRPGGFRLTEKAVRLCGLSSRDAVLDLGCGRGATVNYLYNTHRIRAIGIDPSEKLIGDARKRYAFADFLTGMGENLPFESECFTCVFAECTLSLVENLNGVLKETFRVLKDGGRLVVTDVYARNAKEVDGLRPFSMNSCMRGLHDLTELQETLKKTGFAVSYREDCSDLLKELMVQTVFTFGSMAAFWNLTSGNCMDGCRYQEALKKCKPGYFMMILEKEGTNCG
ncbi:Ubiquinone/menaquinone biosynthesis C-methyltransferase UbiE [bioreactor metagenome]|uniref:Ubiquinone/menaquinone biosynthesis C-methyltransferase UbiE n=1 Tax=bioreactor metagenome TaxID=1076179 RepID=A0A644ZFD2_9ZZZZ|nr:class I SAM-dependent methyltransferase [Oscillibacter sp.]